MSHAGDSDRLEIAVESLSLPHGSGAPRQILASIGFSLAAGEIAALTGPSGCGKTTLLRAIAGLIHVTDGRVRLPNGGRLGFVFQGARLIPRGAFQADIPPPAPLDTR